MTAVKTGVVLPSGFAGDDPPAAWPRPPRFPRPEQLGRDVHTLRGVGPAVSKRLAKLGLRTVRDLLEHVPFRYEAAVPERPRSASISAIARR